jgi:hypothetical protein
VHAKTLLSSAAPSGLVASNVRTSTSEAHSTTKLTLLPDLLQNLVPNLLQKPPTSQKEAKTAKGGKVAGNASDLEAGDGDKSDLEAGAGHESDLEARELAAAAPRVAQAADEQEKRFFTTNSLPNSLPNSLHNRAVKASDLEAAPAAAQLPEHAAATRPPASCVRAAAAAPRDAQPDEQAEISRKLGSKSAVKLEQQQASASERERERESARVAAVEQAVRGASEQTEEQGAVAGSSETPQVETKKKKRKRHKDRHGSAGLSHGVAAESGECLNNCALIELL